MQSAMAMGFSYEKRTWHGKIAERLMQTAAVQWIPAAQDEGNAPIRLLLVSSDRTRGKGLASNLLARGFAVKTAETADALLAASSGIEADVALIEWNPPDMTTIEVLSELRMRGVQLPVVLLSGEGRSTEESLALDWGASDFILQSRGLEVLIRRLKNVARSSDRVEPSLRDVVVGKLRLDQKTNRAL